MRASLSQVTAFMAARTCEFYGVIKLTQVVFFLFCKKPRLASGVFALLGARFVAFRLRLPGNRFGFPAFFAVFARYFLDTGQA
jgi:hypothetical protein